MSNFLFFIVVFFFCLLLFWKWGSEGFVSPPNLTETIVLNKNVPVTKIQIEYVGALMAPREDSWINITDLTIYDKSGKKIEYWKGDNVATFLNGNKGWNDSLGPIEQLWDDSIDTLVHSSVSPETLTIQFGNGYVNGVEIGSILLTNRTDCCENRIQNYNLVLYNMDEIIGSISLVRLGEKGKTVKYKLIPPLTGPKGDKGDTGDVGRQGLQGIVGPLGPRGLQGEIGPVGPKGPMGDTSYLATPATFTDIFRSSGNSEKP